MKYEPLIRKRFDVESQHGDEFLCWCPYHDDTGRPNLYANGTKGVFLCHACGAKGRIEGDVPENWRSLLTRLHDIDIPPPEPTTYGPEWLTQFSFPTTYWHDRGFTDQTISKFNLGYDPIRDDGIIPVRQPTGELIGAIRRRLSGDGPKYLYPRGFPMSQTLFGSWALGSKHSKVALVEGSLDAISCWNVGVPALALLGSRMSGKQQQLLHSLDIEHVVLMLDNDQAGRDGCAQVAEDIWGITVSEGIYRPYWKAKDPGELTRDQLKKMYYSARPNFLQSG